MRPIAAFLRCPREDWPEGFMQSKRIGFGAIAVLALAGLAMSVGGCEDDAAGIPGVTFPDAGSFEASRPDTSAPDSGTPDSALPAGPVAVFGASSFDLGG